MKFGRNLAQSMVPEWADSYIKYKALKKLIKSTVLAFKNGHEVDLAEFLYSLDRNVEDVDSFYNKKFAESARRLKLLEERYGKSSETPQRMEKDELEDLTGALLELRGHLRKLRWYGEVNRRGFVKITKKLDKKLPGTNAQPTYLESKVDPKLFATNSDLIQSMDMVNNWIMKLSNVSDAALFDDASSTHSSLSARTAPSRAALKLPTGLLDTVNQAIRTDDVSILLELLPEAKSGAEDAKAPSYQSLLLSLLQRAISCRARMCIDKLLDQIVTLDEPEDIANRNCIHRLVIAIGRAKSTEDGQPKDNEVELGLANYITPAATPILTPNKFLGREANGRHLLGANDPAVSLLIYLLDSLRPRQQNALKAIDSFGRTPLHYAAQYGFVVVCATIIDHMQAWNQLDVSQGIDGPAWQDFEGWAPLHLSVMGNHPLTTKALLDAERDAGAQRSSDTSRKNKSKTSAVLALATKVNSTEIVKLLVDAGVEINYRDEQGETALHIAARFGCTECASILLQGTDDQRADPEIPEKHYAWTALHIAAVDGQLSIVNLLIDYGVDLERRDSSGWTAKEHAALRGHIDIAKRLAALTTPPDVSDSDVSTLAVSGSPPHSSLLDRNSNGVINSNPAIRSTQTVKTFGHRYLTDESLVLVSLGTMDMRKQTPAVKLDQIPLADAHSTQLDTALSIVVSASGAHGEPETVDLPVHENISTEPFAFYTKDPSKVRLLFDIIPTYAGSKEKKVGRGVALLSSVKPGIGSKKSNLQGDLVVPIIAAETLEVIGSVTFNFLIITPFSHPNMTITENHTYWKSVTSTRLIGHRGLGKNTVDKKSLQLGENTIQSFIAAANLGAQYVEDHVPVIYHDFLVSETGIDAPVHTLTAEQFMHVGEGRTLRPPRPISPFRSKGPKIREIQNSESQRQRSMSVGNSERDVDEMSERMKHTRDFKKKGFKGNSRGNFIQSSFTTLEEMFRKVKPDVGFDIELKYPMLHETEEEDMDTYAVELNSFVDTILAKVYDFGYGRPMIFSSFNPDICLLLSFKQPSIPVLLLTDSGACPVSDIRASSLQEAIRFTSRWNLFGIVSEALPLCLAPRLVRVVKESGLVLMSYGVSNNDPRNANVSASHDVPSRIEPILVESFNGLQQKEGIDAVIVDKVATIRKALTGPEADTSDISTPKANTPTINSNSNNDTDTAIDETNEPLFSVASTQPPPIPLALC
ncbi:MAG: Glycerophosphocholine phosphodiesterase [Cirrosporium novae-zelandiae]|nr:MAG: Glycerophosphocholine phosphodiesterase [Cirrosporium novae-zelandiae]